MMKILELIRQNRFYSVMLIISTTITIAYVMIAVILTLLMTGDFGTEPNRTRTYNYNFFVEKNGDKSVKHYGANRAFIHEVFKDIRELDLHSIRSVQAPIMGFVKDNGESEDLSPIISDEKIFDIYKYKFIEGAPFTKEDVELNNKVAVISESAAFKLLGKNRDVVGSYISPRRDKDNYKIVGLIENTNAILENSYVDVVMPLSGNYSSRGELIKGDCSVVAVVKDEYRLQQADISINKAMATYMNKYKSGDNHTVTTYMYEQGLPIFIPTIFVFIFLLIPAINGLGFSSSYISSRVSEIAIRKAYGASNKDVIGLILLENIAISVIGAIMGLVIAYPTTLTILKLMCAGKNAVIPVELIFDYKQYLILAISLLIFNLFSVYIPLRRVSKRQISDIIKGSSK